MQVRLAFALVLVAGGLAACGGGSSSSASASSGGASTHLQIAASDRGGLSFSTTHLTAKAGRVTIVMRNPGSDSFPHGVAIDGHGVSTAGNIASPGQTSTVTVKLRPGTYSFFCPVGNHRAQGMEGNLTVQ